MPDLLSRAATLSSPLRLAKLPPRIRGVCRHYHDTAACQSTAPANIQSSGALGKDASQMKARKHGFKSLPISPLMRKKTKTKSKAAHATADEDEALAEFRREFAQNPYAHALATPIRKCRITNAHLPSHFLLPFTTTVERSPPAKEGQPPNIKASLQPGRSSDHDNASIAWTSYVANRKDIVRHLGRKQNWSHLVPEQQRTAIARIGRSNLQGKDFIRRFWFWEDQTEAMEAFLGKKAEAALVDALQARGIGEQTSGEDAQPDSCMLAVRLQEHSQADEESQCREEVPVYDLNELLSPEAIDALRSGHLANAEGVTYLPSSPTILRARLALDRLKAYKESDVSKRPGAQGRGPKQPRNLGSDSNPKEEEGGKDRVEETSTDAV